MEQTTYRAERRTIYLGDIPLEVAMLPNGDYCLSQTQVAYAIEKDRNSVLRFFRSKHFKALIDKGFKCYHFEEKLLIEGGKTPISPISIDVACLYWQKWAVAGNERAQQIGLALNKHSLFDLSDYLKASCIEASKLFDLSEVDLEGTDQSIKPVSIRDKLNKMSTCQAG